MDDKSAMSFVQATPKLERTASHSSLSSRFSMMRTPSRINSETQEAELIAHATSQAIIAAKSIMLSGGTQSTALPTAKAAALAILAPKSGSHMVGSSSFLGRRKAKKQAIIIASMAVGSVKNAIQQSLHTGQNSFDQIRGADAAGNNAYQHWDATQILKGHGSPSVLTYNNEYYNPAGNAPTSIPGSRISGNQGSRSSFGFAGSPQPSAVATTISESQATTTHSSTVASFATKEAPSPSLGTHHSIVAALAEIGKSTQVNKVPNPLRDNEPTIAHILTNLASISDLGSTTQSPKTTRSQRSSRTKALVDFLMKKDVLGDDNDSEDVRLSVKAQTASASTEMEANDITSGFPSAEDPIYVRVQKGANSPESKSGQASMRMEQFLQSSNSYDSKDDSCSQGSSAYDSLDATFRTEETGTVDSGGESDTLGYGAYDHRPIRSKNDDSHFFADTASSVLSSISEAFFCSPVTMQPLHAESRDYSGEKDVTNTRDPPISSDICVPKRQQSISSEDTDVIEDRPAYNAKEEAKVTKSTLSSSDVKKSLVHESMEQLVLRALSATPAGYSPSSKSPAAVTQHDNLLTSGRDVSGDGMRPTIAETNSQGADSASASSKSAPAMVGRRIKFPNWVRNRKVVNARNRNDE